MTFNLAGLDAVQKSAPPEVAYNYEVNQIYEGALPTEAMMMSNRGKAKGYDDFWWGLSWSGQIPAIVEISEKGVQFLVENDAQKAWISETEANTERWRARRQMVRKWNWTSWADVTPINREFLLSLTWIPVDPLNAMEVLAKAAL